MQTQSADLQMTHLEKPDRRPRILIVEDDITMKPLWDYVIEVVHSGAIVKWVTSEETAEKAIQQRIHYKEDFDLVISDVFLSGSKTGIDLWRRHASGTSLFLLTSVISPEKFQSLLGQDQVAPFYVQKPLHINTCVDSLKAMLKFRNYTS